MSSTEKAVIAGLKAAINDHGPLTREFITSATKRIVGHLRAATPQGTTMKQYHTVTIADSDGTVRDIRYLAPWAVNGLVMVLSEVGYASVEELEAEEQLDDDNGQ
jgi:hypothetical protein